MWVKISTTFTCFIQAVCWKWTIIRAMTFQSRVSFHHPIPSYVTITSARAYAASLMAVFLVTFLSFPFLLLFRHRIAQKLIARRVSFEPCPLPRESILETGRSNGYASFEQRPKQGYA